MIEQNNPDNNQGMREMQPQMPLMQRVPIKNREPRASWQQRFIGRGGRPMTFRQERELPNWLIGKSVLFFFIAFIACTFVWGFPMEMRFAIISSLSVLLFFYGSKVIINGGVYEREKFFLRNVYILGIVVRLLWAGYCYFFFNLEFYGNTYGDNTDTLWYIPFGEAIADWIRNGFPIPFTDLMLTWDSSIDDVGYPVWLGILNLLSFGESDAFVPYIMKCVIGAYCAICIYNIAIRHYDDGTARMAALFVALNPNMVFWCGNMMKETEMVFLCCLCIDLVDRSFTSGKKLSFRGLLPGLLVAMYIFFFRSALAIVIFLAMGAHIVMASNRVMSAGKKIIAGVMVGIVLLIGMGNRLRTQTDRIVSSVQSDEQEQNMEWRAKRAGGNEFARYAGKAVFAPLIFTIPFPTFNQANSEQITQALLSGGNYIKNIFSFFVILMMILMLISGEWRKHVFILAYTLGYLASLVLSSFAQSSRFHMPIWPFLMLYAAYGIQLSKSNPKYRRWFTIVLIVEVVACLGWNWFKLKGRGMI